MVVILLSNAEPKKHTQFFKRLQRTKLTYSVSITNKNITYRLEMIKFNLFLMQLWPLF